MSQRAEERTVSEKEMVDILQYLYDDIYHRLRLEEEKDPELRAAAAILADGIAKFEGELKRISALSLAEKQAELEAMGITKESTDRLGEWEWVHQLISAGYLRKMPCPE